MNPSEDEIALRRILVALDVSEQSRAALDSAARLAAALKAELVGGVQGGAALLRHVQGNQNASQRNIVF